MNVNMNMNIDRYINPDASANKQAYVFIYVYIYRYRLISGACPTRAAEPAPSRGSAGDPAGASYRDQEPTQGEPAQEQGSLQRTFEILLG